MQIVALRVRNHGPKSASLEVVRGLNGVGCYSVLNALRPVPAYGGLRTLLLQVRCSRAV
jgi:hypothetical protein